MLEPRGKARACRLDAAKWRTPGADLLDLDYPLLGSPQAADVIPLRLNGRLDFVADLENSFPALAPLICRVKRWYVRACT